MRTPPPRFQLRAELIFSGLAALAAIVWMVLIFTVGMTLPAYIAAALFVICASLSSLLFFRATRDLPPEEKTPAPPLSFLAGMKAVEGRCSNCDAPLRKGDKFCSECGAKVI